MINKAIWRRTGGAAVTTVVTFAALFIVMTSV